MDNKLSFKKTTFQNAHFIGNLFNIDFVQCDLTDAYFYPASGYPIVSLNGITYKKSKLLRTQFSNVKFSNIHIVDCFLKDLIFKNVKLPPTTLFALYQQGYSDFRGVRGLKGNIPHQLPPFPLAGGKLSEEVFLHLYRQGLRDFRASNLRGFYLAGTLQREAIPEIELKLEGAHYKKFPLTCGFNTISGPKIGRSSDHHVPAQCIFYFFIQTKSEKEKVFNLTEMSALAVQKMTELNSIANSIQSTVVIRAIALDHKPLWRLKNMNEAHFYWQALPDQDDLMKVVSFTEKSVRRSRRAGVRIFYYFNNFIHAPHVLDNFGKDLLALGLRHIYLGYLSTKGQPRVFYVGDTAQDVILGEVREHLKKMPKPKLESAMTQAIVPPRSKGKPIRIATHIRKVMLNGLRSGLRSGVHYDLSFALMHFLNTAIVYMNRPTPQRVDEQTKEELKQQISLLVKQEGDKRGISAYQRQITINIARQCIERGECFNNQLLHADIIDTLNNLKPDIVQGNAVLWKKLKNFFRDSGQYLSTHFEKVKNFFKRLNPFNFAATSQDRSAASNWRPAPPLFAPNFLRRRHARPPFLAAPGAHIIESMVSKVVLQNLTTKQSLRQALEFDYFSAYVHTASPSSAEIQALPKIYNWYEHPILVEIIRRIEFVFSELGYTPRLDSPFSAEELAGLLYSLWQGLDQCGISKQSKPEAIINLLKQAYFIQCVLDGGFLHSDCQYLEAQALQSEEQEALALSRHKRRVVLAPQSLTPTPPSYFLNITPHPTPKMTVIADHSVAFSLRRQNHKQKKCKKAIISQPGSAQARWPKRALLCENFFSQRFLDGIGHEAANEATFSLHYGLFSNGSPQFLSENPPIPGLGCPLATWNHTLNNSNLVSVRSG